MMDRGDTGTRTSVEFVKLRVTTHEEARTQLKCRLTYHPPSTENKEIEIHEANCFLLDVSGTLFSSYLFSCNMFMFFYF